MVSERYCQITTHLFLTLVTHRGLLYITICPITVGKEIPEHNHNHNNRQRYLIPYKIIWQKRHGRVASPEGSVGVGSSRYSGDPRAPRELAGCSRAACSGTAGPARRAGLGRRGAVSTVDAGARARGFIAWRSEARDAVGGRLSSVDPA